MKKKIFTITLTMILFITFFCDYANASTISEEVIYQDDDFIVTSTLVTFDSNSAIQLFSTTSSKNSSKTITIKNNAGSALATYTLYASFTYNGNSSSSTRVSASSSVKKSGWSFSSRKTSKSGNTASGSYTLKNTNSTKKYSGSVRLSCSKNGTIS